MEWISIKDKFPEELEEVWVFDEDQGVVIATLHMDVWQKNFECRFPTSLHKVTHWRPLIVPEPPRG